MSEENKARARRFYEEVITQKKLNVTVLWIMFCGGLAGCGP
jgi:hypothetical protein